VGTWVVDPSALLDTAMFLLAVALFGVLASIRANRRRRR
jgi:hypothetical protein